MLISVSPAQKQSVARTITLLTYLSQGLAETGSQKTVEAMKKYLATLQKIASAPGDVDLSPEEKVHLEQASFLLEGQRDALMNADFRERADVIEGDVEALGQIAVQYNTRASAR
jgi:hypothetical protein